MLILCLSDHVPFRNSKLTRMLQPSLSGNARMPAICTINPDVSPVAELALDAVLTKDDTHDGHLHNAGVFVVVDLSLASLIWGY